MNSIDSETGLRENHNIVRFTLDKDLCYSLNIKYKLTLNNLLKDTGATMQVINSSLSKINLSLLENTDLQNIGHKIHEYVPDTKARR